MMNVLVRKLNVGSVGGGSRPEWLAPYSLRAMDTYVMYMYMYTCMHLQYDLCTYIRVYIILLRTPTPLLVALLPIAMYN